MALSLQETARGHFRCAGTVDVDDTVRGSIEPVCWGPGVGGHSRQAPERYQDGAAGTHRFLLKDYIALSTQYSSPRNVADAFRLEQSLQNVVFVDEWQFKSGRYSAPQRRLSAARESRDHDERLAQACL